MGNVDQLHYQVDTEHQSTFLWKNDNGACFKAE